MRTPNALFLLLLPLAFCFVSQIAAADLANPIKWEKDIVAYEASDRADPPAKGGIVFIGSSSIRLWKTLATDFPDHHVLNRGFGGSQMSDSAHFAERILIPYAPRMIVVYAGGNDINAGRTPEQVLAAFQALVGNVRAKLADTTIACISIAGNPKRWTQIEKVKATNTLLAEYIAKTPGTKFIDVFTRMLGDDGLPLPDIFVDDRLHMNAKGYALWTDIVGAALPAPNR